MLSTQPMSARLREIRYRHASFSEHEIVLRVFGPVTWICATHCPAGAALAALMPGLNATNAARHRVGVVVNRLKGAK